MVRNTLSVDDPALFEAAVAPWDLLVTPIASGPLGIERLQVVTRDVIAYREEFRVGIRVRGAAPAGFWVLSIPLQVGERTRYWGRPWKRGELPSMLPDALDVTCDAGQVHLVVLVRLERLRQDVPSEALAALGAEARDRCLHARPSRTRSFARWLNAFLQGVWQHGTQEGAAEAFESELLQRIAQLGEDLLPAATPAPALTRRRVGLRKALEHLQSVSLVGLGTPELSRAAGVSQRTLEYAFRDEFDTSPFAYLRNRRLHAARRDLLGADPSEERVGDIAFRHGFFELGRFAGQYRRAFGELPSETLRSGPVPPPWSLRYPF